MVLLRFPSSLLIIALCCVIHINCQFEEYFKWKQIPFASIGNAGADDILFTDPNQSQLTSEPVDYIPYNNIPMGATHYKDRIFVTVPRRRPGIPSTLNVIPTKATRGSSPSYKPFPNAETNRLHSNLQGDPNRIVSVYRTRVDDCNRLWWVDTGVVEYPNNTQQIQRPSIWVYDLERDTVVHRFEIPTSVVEMGQGMASITVDVNPNDCQNAYGYIPDLAAYQLHVYSLAQNRAWTFAGNYFHFDPLRGDFNVAGLRYQWNDGIFSITLGNRQADGYRTAYFHPMAGISEFAISTQVLQNEQNTARQPWELNYRFLGYRGPYTQSAMHVFDPNSGVIFYSQVARNGIGCWNTNTEHSPNNFHLLIHDNETMIYPGDTNIDNEGNLWYYTNSMVRFLYGRIDPNIYNFRLWRANIQDVLRKSPCGSGSNIAQGGSNNFQGGNNGFQGGNSGFQGGNNGFQGASNGCQGGSNGFQGASNGFQGGGNRGLGGTNDFQGYQ